MDVDYLKEKYGLSTKELVAGLARLGLELIISNPDSDDVLKAFEKSIEKAKEHQLLQGEE